MSKKLKVKDLTESISQNQLRGVLSNKRRLGGGPIDNIELINNGDQHFAIVTFEEEEAVDIILKRGDTVVINDVVARVERFSDSCERKQSETPPRSDSENSADTDQVESHEHFTGSESVPEIKKKKAQMPVKKTLKKKDQPLDAISTSEQGSKPRIKRHKVNSQTMDDGEASSLDDSSQSESQPEKPKNKTVQKSTVKQKQSVVNKRKGSKACSQADDTEQVSDLDDTEESESLHTEAKYKTQKPHKETKKKETKYLTKRTNSMPAEETKPCRKRSTDLSQIIDDEKGESVDNSSESESLPERSKNKMRKSVLKSTIKKEKEQSLASKTSSSQNKVLRSHRKESKTKAQTSDDEQVSDRDDLSEKSFPPKSKYTTKKSAKSSAKVNKSSLPKRMSSDLKAQSSDDEHVSDLDISESDSLPQKSKFKTKKYVKSPAKVNKSSVAKRMSSGSSQDLDSDEDLEGQWEVTIKAKVKDIAKSKDFYIYYFEDDNISQGKFCEESLLLDGLNRNLYVMFNTKKAAVATADFQHKPDSNLLKVEMATKEDFDTYSNLLSVHGQFCATDDQRNELMAAVTKQTKMEVVDIIQHDEPRSAIIVFNPKKCQDVSAFTWTPLFYKDVRLIVAPVFKSNYVKVTGINRLSADSTLQRYVSNKKRSCGGEVSNFQRKSETEALVTFKEREGFDGFLGKSQHTLEGCDLHINLYYKCLSPEVYKQQIEFNSKNVKETNNITPVNTLRHEHNPRGQVPLVPRKTSKYKLKCIVGPLYSSVQPDSFKHVQFTLQLCQFGTTFLMRQSKHLQELMQSNHCKHIISPMGEHGFMSITLDWPNKISLKEVREKVKSGLDALCKYLDTFKAAQCNIDKSDIHEFQKFCQMRCLQKSPIVEVFFDHLNNLAVFISDHDEHWIQNCVNKMYHDFMSNISQADDADIKANDADMETLLPKPDVTPRPKTPQNVKCLAHKENSDAGVKDEVKETDTEHLQLNMEETFELEEKDVILFQKTNFHKDVEKENKPLKIVLNSEKMHAIIKGKDMDSLKNAKLDLLIKARDFTALSMTSTMFTTEQLQLLNKQDIQDRINQLFVEKGYHAHFRCNTKMINIFMVKSCDANILKEIVNSHVVVKIKTLDSDTAFIFRSEKGQKFLSDLCESTDGVKISSIVKLQEKCLQIIASSQQIDIIMSAIDRFAEENKSYEQKIPFSSGKQTFVKRFLSHKFSQIVDSLTPLGAKIIQNAESLTVHGLKDGVRLGEPQLSSLSEQILAQEISLKYFGIKEYLQTVEGRSLLASVENNKSCIITQSDSQSGLSAAKAFHGTQTESTKPPNLIAHAKVKECSVLFMQGDITCLNTDAIVNPLDSTLKCQSGLGKALALRGGPNIQTELDSFNMQGIPGEVKVTSAGNLVKFKSIVHVVCPVFTGTEVDGLKAAIKGCITHTENLGIKSLAIPAMGTGKIFKFPSVVACSLLMKTIQQHLKTTSSCLTKICVCDMQADHVKELISRFKNIFDIEVEEVGELQETITKAVLPPPSKSLPVITARAPKHFRNIKVNLITGEIAKQKTDVIVVTVGKSLELSKGGMTKDIVKYGGDEVQEELTKNCGDAIQPGEFGTTSGGNLQCQSIYYARLHHWKGNSAEHMTKLVYKLLESADQQKAASISIPAMGTGKLGYPADVAANTITEAICQFDMDNPQTSLKLINLVVYQQDTEVKQAFEKVMSTGGGSRGTEAGASGSFGLGLIQRFFGGKTEASKHEIQFKSVKLTIKQGDITTEKCDAIISGIRDSLDMSNSGAVCKALLKLCGSGVQDECSDKKNEMEQRGFVATSAPNMNCQQIYHVSMDKFSRHWDKCISLVLTEAENQGLTSIAIPALGTGSRNADHQQIKQKIFSGVDYFSKKSQGNLKDVRLVVYSPELLDVFLGKGDSDKKASSSRYEAEVSTQSLKKVSDRVDLKIYADNHQKIVIVTKELNDVFKEAFKEEKEKHAEVKRLSKYQVQELEDMGMKHCVQVTVSVEEGLITMKGFKAEGFLHVEKLLKTHVLAAVDNHYKSLHQAVKAAIQWQFEQQGKWKNFEPILNSELEKEFKRNSSHHDITDSRDRTYRIDFSKMTEFILDSKGQKSGHSINVRRYDCTREGEKLPKQWEHMGSSENLKLVTLQAASPEYKNVEQTFTKGGVNMPVKKIQRVQNKSLYQQYKAKKREIDHRNPKGNNNEQKLFHGTDSASVIAINENGFNRSYCGKNATAYGNGVYFALASSLSSGYAQSSPQGERLMYIARVLTGVSTPSRSGMSHLPNKPGTNIPYDSGTASGMYIIFHDSQAYPEYLITF